MLGKKIILLGTPRSGTTLLFRALSQHAQLWHLVAESHAILEGPFHPSNFTTFSNRPGEQFQLSASTKEKLEQQFYQQAVNYSSLQSLKLLADFYTGPGSRYVNRAAAEAIGKTLTRLEHIGKHVRLVSLYASVEASRVGDAGRGLGVIAVEFKTLAEEIQMLAVTARADIAEMTQNGDAPHQIGTNPRV